MASASSLAPGGRPDQPARLALATAARWQNQSLEPSTTRQSLCTPRSYYVGKRYRMASPVFAPPTYDTFRHPPNAIAVVAWRFGVSGSKSTATMNSNDP